MISKQVVSQFSQPDTKTVTNALTDFVQTNSSNTIRKIFTVSVATVGLAAVGLASYAIYQSFNRRKTQHENIHLFNDIEFEPNLSKSKRPREEIEEVINNNNNNIIIKLKTHIKSFKLIVFFS